MYGRINSNFDSRWCNKHKVEQITTLFAVGKLLLLVKLFLSMLNICTILFHITVFPSLFLTFDFESTLGSSNRAREKLWGATLTCSSSRLRWRQQYTAAPPCCSNSAEGSLGTSRNSEETLRSWMQLLNTLKILYNLCSMLWEENVEFGHRRSNTPQFWNLEELWSVSCIN